MPVIIEEPLGIDDGVSGVGGNGHELIEDNSSKEHSFDEDEEDITIDSPILKDRYGFFVTDRFHRFLEISEDLKKSRKEKESERALKWIQMIRNWTSKLQQAQKRAASKPSSSSSSNNSAVAKNKRDYYAYLYSGNGKLKSRTRKGIPDSLRGFVWYHYAHGEGYKLDHFPDVQAIDTSVLSPVTIDEIERDIDRTFPRHIMFLETNGAGQQALRNLLRRYAALDPEVGYCQGMGFIAGLFLTYMIEDHAFYTFYSVLNRPQCPLRQMYLPRLIETQKVLHIFECLGRLHLPVLWSHFEREGIHPTMFFTEWAMTMFCRGFSFELVTRVWDIFLYEGDYKIVYRVSLAILKNFEKDFLAKKFDKIMGYIRDLPHRVDAPTVLDLCWTIPLRRAQIKQYSDEYDARMVK